MDPHILPETDLGLMVSWILMLMIEPVVLQGIDNLRDVGLAQRGALDRLGPASPLELHETRPLGEVAGRERAQARLTFSRVDLL